MQFRKQLAIAVLLLAAAVPANGQRLPPGVGEREVNLYAQLLAMTDTRTLDTTFVARALSSNWRPLRAVATLAIGQVGPDVGRAGAARLRALLKDSDLTVAANAAYALGLLRDSASIPDLSAALSASHEVAREAAWALGEIGAPARIAIISGLQTDKDHNTAIQLLLAAAKLRPVPLAEIRPYLRNGHPSLVWAAAYAIARIRAPGGVRDLIELEASPALSARPQHLDRSVEMSAPYTDALSGHQRARAEIARGLAKSAAGDSLGPKAFAVLARLAGDVAPHVRINAVRSLGPPHPVRAAIIATETRNDFIEYTSPLRRILVARRLDPASEM